MVSPPGCARVVVPELPWILNAKNRGPQAVLGILSHANRPTWSLRRPVLGSRRRRDPRSHRIPRERSLSRCNCRSKSLLRLPNKDRRQDGPDNLRRQWNPCPCMKTGGPHIHRRSRLRPRHPRPPRSAAQSCAWARLQLRNRHSLARESRSRSRGWPGQCPQSRHY